MGSAPVTGSGWETPRGAVVVVIAFHVVWCCLLPRGDVPYDRDVDFGDYYYFDVNCTDNWTTRRW